MNRYLVVDCSFFMSCALPDEQTKYHDLSLFEIIVPNIFYLECLNVLSMAFKRGRINIDNFHDYLSIVREFPCIIDGFSSTKESLLTIAKLSNQYDIKGASLNNFPN